MSDDAILANLLRRFLANEYWDTGWQPHNRLCLDGTLYDITDEELAALDRVPMPEPEKP